jgi:hypothetical protein
VGTISGEHAGIAIFLDAAKGIVRLKIGESYLGWTLEEVRGREATLKKDRETAVIAISILTANQNSPPSAAAR